MKTNGTGYPRRRTTHKWIKVIWEGKNGFFPTNGAEASGYPKANNECQHLTSHQLQKLTPTDHKPKSKKENFSQETHEKMLVTFSLAKISYTEHKTY